jgi:hypothetical protein
MCRLEFGRVGLFVAPLLTLRVRPPQPLIRVQWHGRVHIPLQI